MSQVRRPLNRIQLCWITDGLAKATPWRILHDRMATTLEHGKVDTLAGLQRLAPALFSDLDGLLMSDY